MKKTTILVLLSAFSLSACGSVDDIINDAVSGDVTKETIQLKEKAIIINDVSLEACVVIKNSLVQEKEYQNAETLVTEKGVTCATYSKQEGEATDLDPQCVETTLDEWLQFGDNADLIDIDASGDKACVIGFDL